jgi:hypothetical protein
MLKPQDFLRDTLIHQAYQPQLTDWLKPWRIKTHTNILVVVDTEISISSSNGFGISTVIDLIRNARVGCMKFKIDIAQRSSGSFTVNANPSNEQAKYTGFRFDSSHSGDHVIDAYDQVWCFGFKPDNGGGPDSDINLPFALATSNSELEKLDEWMTAHKGGLFGTGDHDFLGASMCHKMPRLGTMRRWTNADGVPPIGTHDRIDTLRPPSAAYEPGAPGGPLALGNNSHQGDLAVQPIEWVPWKTVHHVLYKSSRPHPVLCHPTLGPIDVMPDHAHEGLCVVSPDLTANKQFNSEKEYPNSTTGGAKPAPQIIAYGSNLGSPPYNFTKGEQPARSNNPMISVYDGHSAGVGRVATDSTWHHWMGLNLDNMKAANNDDWKKISRYFINLAIWLNPPNHRTWCFYLAVVASHVEYPGFQEYSVNASVRQLGQALKSHLIGTYGPCWVSESIWDVFGDLELYPLKKIPDILKDLDDREVDIEDLELLVLGNMVKATLESAKQMKSAPADTKGRKLEPLYAPEKLFVEPVKNAIEQFVESQSEHGKSCQSIKDIFA